MKTMKMAYEPKKVKGTSAQLFKKFEKKHVDRKDGTKTKGTRMSATQLRSQYSLPPAREELTRDWRPERTTTRLESREDILADIKEAMNADRSTDIPSEVLFGELGL